MANFDGSLQGVNFSFTVRPGNEYSLANGGNRQVDTETNNIYLEPQGTEDFRITGSQRDDNIFFSGAEQLSNINTMEGGADHIHLFGSENDYNGKLSIDENDQITYYNDPEVFEATRRNALGQRPIQE